MKKQFDIYTLPIIDKKINWRKVEEPLAYEYYMDDQIENGNHPRIIDLKNFTPRNRYKGKYF
jgi:hypothetical protein